MCGIAAVISLSRTPLPDLAASLEAMNELQRHRGPDGEGTWQHADGTVGLGHRRLAVIDVQHGHQPMHDAAGRRLSLNGEIYNYRELRAQLGSAAFRTASDTEVLLHAYGRWGVDMLEHLRGMFAFVLWDEVEQLLFCARDRCGLKPLYYTVVDGTLFVASEIKALLPFVPAIETDPEGYRDYLTFQTCLEGRTLFKGVMSLEPGQWLRVRNGSLEVSRYWTLPEGEPEADPVTIEARVRQLVEEAVALHLPSDVPIGAYLSGGVDSSIVASTAARETTGLAGIVGAFAAEPGYDERAFARCVAESHGFPLHEVEIGEQHFVAHISDVIYHLDYPVAGPGALPQYIVNSEGRTLRKVLLGGQGGDELFGGYPRYVIADGSVDVDLSGFGDYAEAARRVSGHAIDDVEGRYFRLIDRTNGAGGDAAFETFLQVFRRGGPALSPVDRMMRFDFHALLPALLHVDDRVSMAHGIETRAPLLDHPLVEFVTRVPARHKIVRGVLKRLLRDSMRHVLPDAVHARREKMGFPVPFQLWLRRPGPVRDFVHDVLLSDRARSRQLPGQDASRSPLENGDRFDRAVWGQFCVELWHRRFHDEVDGFQRLRDRVTA